MRSLIHNFETNTMIYSERLGKEMEEAFLKDQEHSIEFDPNIVLKRNFKKKFRDMWARNFRTLI
jgi:phosphatidylserine/phosphatidylglycerophosphate/cardiolipin synthase-like enzyme